MKRVLTIATGVALSAISLLADPLIDQHIANHQAFVREGLMVLAGLFAPWALFFF